MCVCVRVHACVCECVCVGGCVCVCVCMRALSDVNIPHSYEINYHDSKKISTNELKLLALLIIYV